MKKAKKRSGSVYLLVVAVFLFTSLTASVTILSLGNSTYQMHAYGLQTKAFYLNHEAQEASIAALTADDNEQLKALAAGALTETTAEYQHIYNEQSSGKSEIRVAKETHKYYGEDKDWAVIYVTTYLPEERGSRQGEFFTYSGVAMILIENPVILLYNLQPDSLDNITF